MKKLLEIKGQLKLKLCQKISNCYDEMKYRRQSGHFQFEEDLFSSNSKSIAKIMQKKLQFLKFLQTKPQVKSMINN